MAVVHDMKEDSGVVPVEPMGGDEKGLRVGYSIDTSVDLGNAAHHYVGTMLPRDSVSRLRILREQAPTGSSCCQMYMV